MTTREFEKRLKKCNPDLYIKRYGTDKVGVHLGSKFIIRLMVGDITPYNSFKYKSGRSQSMATKLNPRGYYKMKLLVGRGRMEAARILYTDHLISLADVAYLSK